MSDMTWVTRRNALTAIELILGIALILFTVKISYNMFRPISGGHIDGRGLLSHVIIPPIAALGGCLIAHVVPRYAPIERERIIRYISCAVFAVLAVIPSVLYILFFSDENISKSLGTYDIWFVIALVVGLAIAGVSDIRSW